jgi:predicted enzyme related to lactoylglutathione lyase
MTPIVVWAEICVRDLAKATEFYEHVFQYETKREVDGPLDMISFVGGAGVPSAHLIQGTPAKEGSGAIVHFAIKGSLEDAIARCAAAGGAVQDGIVDIPLGRFQYVKDLDGNPIGIFEPRI